VTGLRHLVAAALVAAAPAVVSPAEASTAAFVAIPGGTFAMGSSGHYREETVVREVTVSGFRLSRTEVTNARFRAFVEATGYVTAAERGLDAEDYPGLPAALRRPGSMVFAMPEGVTDRSDVTQWWSFVPGASWRRPTGPGSSIAGLDDHPVVQVAAEDARAYAAWRGGRLPTEAEWEYAARGGLEGEPYAWGAVYRPDGTWMANTWQGAFPTGDDGADGFTGTAPVASFAANGYGLHDMAGNVWEYVADWWVPGHPTVADVDPTGPPAGVAAKFSHPAVGARHVVKGGSWLCAPDFCARYRPAARQPQDAGLGSNHIGFRIVLDGE